MLAELQKGIQANDAVTRSAALESLVTILEMRGHELSPAGMDEFADVLTRLLRSLPAPLADKSAARLTQALLGQSATGTDEHRQPDALPTDNPSAATNTLLAQDDLDAADILGQMVAPILSEVIAQHDSAKAVSAVHAEMLERAAEAQIDAMTTQMIVSRGNDAARIAVAQNPGAMFARSTLTTLAELAISDLSLKNALAARHDLPEAIGDRLWPFLSEESKVTMLTARRSPSLADHIALAEEEGDGIDIHPVDALDQRIRAGDLTLPDAIAQLAGEGRLLSVGLLAARCANAAPICGAHAILSPAERPLVMLLKASGAGAAGLADGIRLRARCGIGASKDSRFAAMVMDGVAMADAQQLTRLMGERLEKMMAPRAESHAA